MARWPIPRGMPDASPFPGGQMPRFSVHRKRPARSRRVPVQPAPVARIVSPAPAREVLEVVAAERPNTFDHELAIAARLGRRRHRLPEGASPAAAHAYQVARARMLARNWAWLDPELGKGAGFDNRRQRAAFKQGGQTCNSSMG